MRGKKSKTIYRAKQSTKEAYNTSRQIPQGYFVDEDEDDECVQLNPGGGKHANGRSETKGSNNVPSKKPRQKGLLDLHYTTNPVNVVKVRKDQGRQKTNNE